MPALLLLAAVPSFRDRRSRRMGSPASLRVLQVLGPESLACPRSRSRTRGFPVAAPRCRRRVQLCIPSMTLLFMSHHPCSSKGEVVLADSAHDDVVEDANADILQRLRDLVRCVDVLLAGVAFARGVIVDEHHAAGVVDTGFADNVGRVYNAGAYAATTDLDGSSDNLVPDVEQDHEEVLVVLVVKSIKAVENVSNSVLGTGDTDGCPLPIVFHDQSAGEIACRHDTGCLHSREHVSKRVRCSSECS